MNRAKKDRPEVAASRRQRPGLAPRTIAKLLYQILGKKQAPIWTGEEVSSPMTGWELMLAVCGTGCLVGGLFRVIDLIERR